MGCVEGETSLSPGLTIDFLCEPQFPYPYSGVWVDIQAR